jgi:hypothetical protein
MRGVAPDALAIFNSGFGLAWRSFLVEPCHAVPQRPFDSAVALAVPKVPPPRLANPRSAALPCLQKKLQGRLLKEEAMLRPTPESEVVTSDEYLHAIAVALMKNGRLDFEEFADTIRLLSDTDLVRLTRLLRASGYTVDSDW